MAQARTRALPAEYWPRRTHWAAHVPAAACGVTLLGRLVEWSGRGGLLVDESGAVRVRCLGTAGAGRSVAAGDIVAARGAVQAGALEAVAIDRLVPGRPALAADSDWAAFAERGGVRARNLRVRAQVLAAVREFFAARGFLEVETPIFSIGTGHEAHIEFFRTEFRTGRRRLRGVLIPSPEHHMKRLLGAGFERLYQMGRCFRNGERSVVHNPEFTLLEWYRAFATYAEVMQDVEDLVRAVAGRVRGASVLVRGGRSIDVGPAWPRVTVESAFRQHAGVDLRQCRDAAALCRAAAAAGCRSVRPDDTFEDAFHKLLVERVEPALAPLGAWFLQDYPVELGALARRKPGDPRWAERAEAYVGGVELANGFGELNDVAEQRRRFRAEAAKRRAAGRSPMPADRAFLRMLAAGMPPAAGMALGVDRLVMLCVGATTLDDVLAFPLGRAAADGGGATL